MPIPKPFLATFAFFFVYRTLKLYISNNSFELRFVWSGIINGVIMTSIIALCSLWVSIQLIKQAYMNPKKCQVSKKINEHKISCSICLCNIKKGEWIYDTCHQFHSNCFDLWYVCQQSCPLCRKNI